MLHLGDIPAGSTLYIPFASYSSSGASVTASGLAVTDVEIYKNGSVTQRASDAGLALLDTDGLDFDGITGVNGFSIDLSDNTDSGFYSVGGFYWVIVSSVTIDSQTVNFIAATFRIVEAEAATGRPSVGVASIANGAVTAAAIATDAIDADAIADNAINAASIADGAITAAKFSASAIDAAALSTDAAQEIADTVLTRQMTESYAANGAAPTLAQALFAIHQDMMDFSISGTAKTVQQLDGSTAFVVTLNDATSPTGATRA
jgi:hypothetical protein